jgi:hypothetical protein
MTQDTSIQVPELTLTRPHAHYSAPAGFIDPRPLDGPGTFGYHGPGAAAYSVPSGGDISVAQVESYWNLVGVARQRFSSR